jgi:hypothetical protein
MAMPLEVKRSSRSSTRLPTMVVRGGVVNLINDRDRAESVSPSPRRPPDATP